MIAVGAFSPLRGFMNQKDYLRVVREMRLERGLPWSMPVTLATSEEHARTLAVGSEVALRAPDGRLVAVLDLHDKFSPDKDLEAQRVYGTTETKHPGVAYVMGAGAVYLGGPVHVLERSGTTAFPAHHRDPAQTRAVFAERKWSRVVGFQTRNPIHRAHEFITKTALEICDGLMIHPLVGATKGDDIPADVRMRCYEALIERYYVKERVLLSIYPAAMRYAGPREAIFHAIARKNYGCSHFIVGRDHAGVGSYYGTYDAQRIFGEFAPGELGIEPLFFENAFFSKAVSSMGTDKTAPRRRVDEGEPLRHEGARDAVARRAAPARVLPARGRADPDRRDEGHERSRYADSGSSCTQLADPRFVLPPALDRGAVDRLSCLPLARGPDGVGVSFGLKAGRIPLETAERDQPSRGVLGCGRRVLVDDVEHSVGRQHRAPVVHQTEVLPIVRGEIAMLAREPPVLRELSRVDGKAGVDRVAPAVNDPRARQEQVNEANPEEVERHLVRHAECIWARCCGAARR